MKTQMNTLPRKPGGVASIPGTRLVGEVAHVFEEVRDGMAAKTKKSQDAGDDS